MAISAFTAAAKVRHSVNITPMYRSFQKGVYRSGESTPFREYNTDVQILPKADRTALEHGKTVHTMAEVEKIVEDYDG